MLCRICICLAAGVLFSIALSACKENSKRLLYSSDIAIGIESVNLNGITLKYKNISNQSGWLYLPLPVNAKEEVILNGINPYLVFVFYGDESAEAALENNFAFTQFESSSQNVNKIFLRPNEEYVNLYGSKTLYVWGPCGAVVERRACRLLSSRDVQGHNPARHTGTTFI